MQINHGPTIRIGTRDSQLATCQATLVKNHLSASGIQSELIFINSNGDIDLTTPIYEIGVQGVFTKTLDTALLNNNIDIAVHSMKDVPTQLAKGIRVASILKRDSFTDLLVYKTDTCFLEDRQSNAVIATSSIRRSAQWKNRFPNHVIVNLRGNINTRLSKLEVNEWSGAIFASAGLERILIKPEKSIELDWMLPAPAQGAIVVVCREEDDYITSFCRSFHDTNTAICTKIERDFLRLLHGGCSSPVSALAEVKNNELFFKGNITSPDGKKTASVEKKLALISADDLGIKAADELLSKGGREIIESIQKNLLH